jgi:hypothetical protein
MLRKEETFSAVDALRLFLVEPFKRPPWPVGYGKVLYVTYFYGDICSHRFDSEPSFMHVIALW